MEYSDLYADIAERTGGDIYIGVVGPVRTGKSTLIKRFMELMILPEISDEAFGRRARDELPQSAAGRTIMTTEPKFVPEQAVRLELEGGIELRARMIDCVGYLVPGAMGHEEGERPRMVKSPWFDDEVPFDTAAEMGTRKVICEHSTIGLAVTTDGSISDIPRENYVEAEQRVVEELEAIHKPFVILLNCVEPQAPESLALAAHLQEKYGHAVLPVSCAEMTQGTIHEVLRQVLLEFPVKELAFAMPKWVTMLSAGHWLQQEIYAAVREYAEGITSMRDLTAGTGPACPSVKQSCVRALHMGTGCAEVALQLDDGISYTVLSEETGLDVPDEESLLPCVLKLARVKAQYDKLKSALEEVEATGYGIVMPSMDELRLEEPEIIHQGGRSGVRLKASAPSIHMMKIETHTEVSPIVGSEKQTEELVASLLQEFEEDPLKLWQSNIFGKSLHELVNEGLQAKLLNMPMPARAKMQETLERVINEGCSGLICILL